MAKQSQARVHAVTGSDDLAVKEDAAAWAKRLAPAVEWGLEIIDGWVDGPDQMAQAVRRVIEAVDTPPFLADEKLVWFKNVTAPSDEELGRGAATYEALDVLAEALARGVPDNVRLLISAPGLDRRRSFFKALQASGEVRIFDLPAQTGRKGDGSLEEMAADAFRGAGKEAEAGAVARLAALCGPDPWLLRAEAEKACLYAGDAPRVSATHVDEVVTPARAESHWDWCDAVVEGNFARALRLLRQLEFQRENPVGLIAALSSHARLLVQCRVLLDRGWLAMSGYQVSIAPEAEEILARGKTGKMPGGFRVRRVGDQASAHPLRHWLQFLDLVYDAYLAMFRSGLTDFRAMEMLCVKVAELASQKSREGSRRAGGFSK